MIRETLLASVACAGLLTARAEVINVLTLGAKNDGSADVSAIVNANTAKGALFFPAGIYKVVQPLLLKNPIRGEGYARISNVLIPACASSSPAFLMMYSAYKLNTQGDNIQP